VGKADISQAAKARPNAILPTQAVAGEIDLIDQVIGKSLNQILLAADMIVERHGAYAQVVRKAPHCYGFGSLAVCERKRFGKHPLATKTLSVKPFSSRFGLGCHGTDWAELALHIYVVYVPCTQSVGKRFASVEVCHASDAEGRNGFSRFYRYGAINGACT
jgi:hypothetical protein